MGSGSSRRTAGCLSDNERAVVEYAVRGEPDKVAAFGLDMAPSTVANPLRRAMAKLGLTDGAQLIRTYAAIVRR